MEKRNKAGTVGRSKTTTRNKPNKPCDEYFAYYTVNTMNIDKLTNVYFYFTLYEAQIRMVSDFLDVLYENGQEDALIHELDEKYKDDPELVKIKDDMNFFLYLINTYGKIKSVANGCIIDQYGFYVNSIIKRNGGKITKFDSQTLQHVFNHPYVYNEKDE